MSIVPTLRRRDLLAVLIAMFATLVGPNAVANAQAATTVPTPVTVALDGTQSYFVVVSSEDGILEAVVSDTTGSFGYPAKSTCAQRLTAVAAGTECFRSLTVATPTAVAEAIGFQGTAASVQAALATLTFTPATGVVLSEARIQVNVTLNPGPSRALFYNPTNGHY